MYHEFEQPLHFVLKFMQIHNIWIVNENLICLLWTAPYLWISVEIARDLGFFIRSGVDHVWIHRHVGCVWKQTHGCHMDLLLGILRNHFKHITQIVTPWLRE